MNEPKLIILIKLVPVRHRRDGWTAEKRYPLHRTLAETGIVEDRRAQLLRGTSEHGDRRRIIRSRVGP